jgi:hypothetical protein
MSAFGEIQRIRADRRPSSLFAIAIFGLAMVVYFVLFPHSALAARGHVFSGTIGEPCTAAPCGPGELKEPSAVAVNETTGNVYVLDQGNDRVGIFDSADTYLGQITEGASA